MVKNICEKCIHSSQSEPNPNRVGEYIFNYLCDVMNTNGYSKAAVNPHAKCPKYIPKSDERNWKKFNH